LNFFEKRRGGPFVYIPPEDYPTHVAKLITTRLGIDPDTITGRLNDFFDQCEQRLAVYKYAELPTLAALLEQDLRQVKTMARPDEAQARASRESIHGRAIACGWTAEEIDRLIAVAGGPAAISNITWRSATVNGREIDRGELRQSLRSAAYSNAGWEKRLAEMPPIAEPSEEPR
jgi:hypothetical protein